MNANDIDRALFAFRMVCPSSTILTHLDGTKEPFECFRHDAKEKRKFRCNGKCGPAKAFINILKEPKQY